MAKAAPWTPEELDTLRKLWPDMTVEEISDRIPGRSAQACHLKAARIGLPRKGYTAAQGVRWTPEEDETLRAHWLDEGSRVADRLPLRSRNACSTRARKLGLVGRRRIWTPEEDVVVCESYERMGANAMVAAGMLPGRTAQSIRTHASALGLHRAPGGAWTPREDRAIRACIPRLRACPDERALVRLANGLDRPLLDVAQRMRYWLEEAA